MAYRDGSFVLYDNDALTNANGAPQAVSQLRLPTRGEPRTLVFTGKSVPTAWIGTDSGEVVQVTVVRTMPSI